MQLKLNSKVLKIKNLCWFQLRSAYNYFKGCDKDRSVELEIFAIAAQI
jgi:hypothetical protein